MDFSLKNCHIQFLILPSAGLILWFLLLTLFAWNYKNASQEKLLLLKNLESMHLVFEKVNSRLHELSSEEIKIYLDLGGDILKGLSANAQHSKGNEVREYQKELKIFFERFSQTEKVEIFSGEVASLLKKNKAVSERIEKAAYDDKNLAFILSSCSIGSFCLLLGFIIYQFNRVILNPLISLEKKSEDLMEGKGERDQSDSGNLFFYSINNNLKSHQKRLQQLATLAEEIGDGNFNQNDEDFRKTGALGHSIGVMREKIRTSFQNEEKRRWAIEGITKFSTLIREHSNDLNLFCNSLISQLIKFMAANQGGLFLIDNQDEQVLVLQASYAWGRQKHYKKSYYAGEGLIGQVALEKEFILLKEIPEDFVTIGSGLGDAKPTCIIILPLIADDELYGVLEIATFKEFEQHHIDFLHEVCEITASAIATAKGSNVTKELLHKAEEANAQLKSQEEELRMNTEELMATQEAMVRKEAELEKLQEKLRGDLEKATIEMERQIKEIESEKIKNEAILEGCVDAVVSFNEEGKIEYFNKAAEDMWGISRKEAFQVKIQEFIPVEISVANGEMKVYYLKNGNREILNARTEVLVKERSGQEMEVLLTLTRVKVEGTYTFTAFAQKVAVELF